MPKSFSASRAPNQLPAMGGSATQRLSQAPGGGSSAEGEPAATAQRQAWRSAAAPSRRAWPRVPEDMAASLADRAPDGQLSPHRLRSNHVIFLRGVHAFPVSLPDGRVHVRPSVARRYARFALGLALADIPAPVVEKASLLVLDTLGSCLASSREEFGRAVLEAAERLGGQPESTLIGAKSRTGAASPVLANATLAHGLDFDDTREDAIVHTGCLALTTTLAAGEANGAWGRDALEATIAGVEVMCRIGLAVPGRFHARHYHPTSLTASFAAAAVTGRLYGLTEDQMVHAF